MVGVAQLVRAAGCGPAGRGFKSRHSPHFFAQILGKKTWSLKRLRFMARSAASCSVSCASYGEAVLHNPPFQMKQFHFIPLWSIVPLTLHNVKHSLRSYYEKMKKWELEWSSVRARSAYLLFLCLGMLGMLGMQENKHFFWKTGWKRNWSSV